MLSRKKWRAVRPLLALDRHIAGKTSEIRLPRNGGVRREVGDRRDVGIGRNLADLARREAREARAVLQQSVERLA
jgi:hypothetical protein